MEKYLNMGIKDVIKEFPEVGRILEELGVGCVNCNIGTCLTKDIIGIHNLSRRDEAVLMGRIEKIIYPDREIIIEEFADGEELKGPLEYSAPIKELVLEHDNIKRLLYSIPRLCELMREPEGMDFKLVLDCVEFIKNYADKFHHSKEEDILFKYADANSDIIKTMLEEHKLARWFVKGILNGLEKNNVNMVTENLTSYGELLIMHIKREDEILYPFIERNCSGSELEELAKKFKGVDEAVGNGFSEKWMGLLDRVEGLR